MNNRAVKITDNVYWVGVNDRKTARFENLWPLDKGVAYNSYIIKDEKTVLIDTVEKGHYDRYLDKVRDILDGKTLDYLVINHMEPDHSGSIRDIVALYPNVKIVGNKKTFAMLEAFYGITENTYEVKEGDEIDLGGRKLKFYMIPMVHWPESMTTFDTKDGILFCSDAFGSFGTLDGSIFDDELNLEFYEEEFRRYYSNIVGKYGIPIQNALKKLKKLDLKYLASSHGPIWRENLAKIIEKYDKWSRFEAEEAGAVIVYGTMYGNTEKMADAIAKSLSENGIKNIKVFDASKTHQSYILSAIWKYKGLILGSCAYNTDMYPTMQSLTHELKLFGVKNRIVGVFGTFAWSGGGVKGLNKIVEEMKLEVGSESVEVKGSPNEEDLEKCARLGKDIACLLNGNCY